MIYNQQYNKRFSRPCIGVPTLMDNRRLLPQKKTNAIDNHGYYFDNEIGNIAHMSRPVMD